MKAITTPILPCADLDHSISFYEALGFKRTYRQERPNPYAVVERGEIVIHLFGLEDFDPEAARLLRSGLERFTEAPSFEKGQGPPLPRRALGQDWRPTGCTGLSDQGVVVGTVG